MMRIIHWVGQGLRRFKSWLRPMPSFWLPMPPLTKEQRSAIFNIYRQLPERADRADLVEAFWEAVVKGDSAEIARLEAMAVARGGDLGGVNGGEGSE